MRRMRYSYGIMDQRKILLYKPQLFLKSNDLLIFPSTEFQGWHASIKEFIDGLYQINSIDLDKNKSINITELNLTVGVLNNITEEFEKLFDPKKVSDFSYHYVSTLNEKYKKLRSPYSSDMRRCDIQIQPKIEITPHLKQKHINEIIEEALKKINKFHL